MAVTINVTDADWRAVAHNYAERLADSEALAAGAGRQIVALQLQVEQLTADVEAKTKTRRKKKASQ